MAPNIHYKGFDSLNLRTLTDANIKKLVTRAARKYTSGAQELTVHLKKYEKDGARAKYSVNIRIEGRGKPVLSGNHHGWRAVEVVRAALESIELQLEKREPKRLGKPTRRTRPGVMPTRR
jgi:hypothetical protein